MTQTTSTQSNDWNLKTKQLTDTFFELAGIPSISSSTFVHDDSISAVFSQRDIDNNTTTQFVRTFEKKKNEEGFHSSGFPLQLSNVDLVSYSPSGRYMCLFKRNTNASGANQSAFVAYQIEIWDRSRRVCSISASDLHGKVYSDAYFSRVCWTRDESTLYYLAEFAEKAKSYQKCFWDKDFSWNDEKEDKEVNSKRSVGKYNIESQEDWGEQLVGAKVARVFRVNWTHHDRHERLPVLIKGVDSSVTMNSPVLTPDEKGIVFVGYNIERRRLGLVYCFQRPNDLYHLTFADNIEDKAIIEKITPENEWNALRPVFSPDGSQLVWLTTGKVPYHNTCKKLMSMRWPSRETRVVVDYVEDPVDEFQGIYSVDLSQSCWSSDSRFIYLNTCQRSIDTILRIEIENGAIHRVQLPDEVESSHSLVFLNSNNDKIVAYQTSPNLPYRLLVGTPDFTDGNKLVMKWTSVCDSYQDLSYSTVEKLKNISFKIVTVQTEDKTTSFDSIVVEPIVKPFEPHPLIMIPHGGPHSNYTTIYLTTFTYFATLGYTLSLVNYRGSVGYGMKPLRSLVGKCGFQDVSDVHAATTFMLENYNVHREKIAVYGGSHGGFLTGHMISQYPDIFRAAVLHNPVINIPSMTPSTDIPDWCYTEANGLDYEEEHEVLQNLSDEEREKLLVQQFRSSPICHVHKVDLDRCAVLIVLGEEDKRVPIQQGKEFYYALKKRSKDPSRLQLHMYPKNGHPISSAECEADRSILATVWFARHLSQ